MERSSVSEPSTHTLTEPTAWVISLSGLFTSMGTVTICSGLACLGTSDTPPAASSPFSTSVESNTTDCSLFAGTVLSTTRMPMLGVTLTM